MASANSSDNEALPFLVPSLQEILKLRQHPKDSDHGAFKFFVSEIVAGVVGQRKWSKTARCFTRVSDPEAGITVSDEAFALLIVENIWDVVMLNGETCKYTGKLANTSNKRHDGWSAEGLERYNALHEKVKKNRSMPFAEAVETNVMEDFKKEMYPQDHEILLSQEDLPTSSRKKRPRKDEETGKSKPEAVMDLTSDEEGSDDDIDV